MMAGNPPEADPTGGAERLCRTGTQIGSENRPEIQVESPDPSGTERDLVVSGLPPRRASALRGDGGGPICEIGASRSNSGPSGTDETLRRLIGRSAQAESRRKPPGGQALAAGRQRCRHAGGCRSPVPVQAGMGKPEQPPHGESRAYRKASEIDGENRAIRDRRRPTITKAMDRSIRGDADASAGTGSVAGNGTDILMPTTQATTNIASETRSVFRSLPPVPVCAGTAARRPERVVVAICNRTPNRPSGRRGAPGPDLPVGLALLRDEPAWQWAWAERADAATARLTDRKSVV